MEAKIVFDPKVVVWGSGAVLDKDGQEIAKVRIEPQNLTEEQKKELEKLRGNNP
jgi:hypothetical protein